MAGTTLCPCAGGDGGGGKIKQAAESGAGNTAGAEGSRIAGIAGGGRHDGANVAPPGGQRTAADRGANFRTRSLRTGNDLTHRGAEPERRSKKGGRSHHGGGRRRGGEAEGGISAAWSDGQRQDGGVFAGVGGGVGTGEGGDSARARNIVDAANGGAIQGAVQQRAASHAGGGFAQSFVGGRAARRLAQDPAGAGADSDRGAIGDFCAGGAAGIDHCR